MFIGFPVRRSEVFENQAPDIVGLPFRIFRTIHSLRKSEITYPLTISVSESTATLFNAEGTWDVSFGSRDPISNVFVTPKTLNPGDQTITDIEIFIFNDAVSEDNETFTLRVSAADVGGVRQNFECYDDVQNPVEGNYFCSHTVTIVDGDRKCCHFLLIHG